MTQEPNKFLLKLQCDNKWKWSNPTFPTQSETLRHPRLFLQFLICFHNMGNFMSVSTITNTITPCKEKKSSFLLSYREFVYGPKI